MKTLTLIAALSGLTLASQTKAESLISKHCGPGHVNEVASADDVSANPDGYYIRSLQEQVSHGDPRIVTAVGDVFYLCTGSAATPEMDAGRAALLMNERRVRYLFVPNDCPKAVPAS